MRHFMDYNQNNTQENTSSLSPHAIEDAADKMAHTALILAALSLLGCVILPIISPMILGTLAIVFAILSKGPKRTLSATARNAIICSVVALVINLFASAYYINSALDMLKDESFRTELNQMYESLYGESFDEMLEDITGTDSTNEL